MSRSPALALVLAVPAALTAALLGAALLLMPPARQATCDGQGEAGEPAGAPAASAASTAAAAGLPPAGVAGYRGTQLVNAALIMNAAAALGLDAHAQTIAVMTAMGESALTVVDHGDAVGPDSRGLFQQRANGAWGSYADRMDPTRSATSFLRALAKVPGWQLLAPTIAAHRVQANADPYYYAPFWPRAQQVVAALAARPLTLGQPAASAPAPVTGPATTATTETTGAACPAAGASAAADVPVGAGGWTRPAVGPVTSPYGMRLDPVAHVYRLHSGIDVGAPCQAPIYAAAAGQVVQAGPASGYGDLIAIDHGVGVVTRYGHMYPDGVLVRVGDHVTAGQVIARVGAAGEATACHLHFEVLLGDAFTDPAPYLASHGVPLG